MKILFLQKRILFPTDTGGKIRTLNVVRHLAGWHEVTYLCNEQEEDQGYLESMRAIGVRLETTPWREVPRGSAGFYRDLALNLCSRYPFNVNKDFDPVLRNRALQLLEEEHYDLVVCDFVQMARNAIDLPGPPKVLFQHNVEAEIFRRHSEHDRGWLRRCYMGLQWRKMRRFEGAAGRRFDTVIAVSDHDREIFERDYGWTHVETIDTAVDVEHFSPNGKPENPNHVVFVGSMDWLANQDAVTDFARRTWPLLKAQVPTAVLQVVGRNPPPSITSLAKHEDIEVTGTVPDVRPYLNEAGTVIVPLRIGGGTRLKIFEAMAMQKAVVSTTVGAEGLPVTSGRDIVIADSPQELADSIAKVLTDEPWRHQIAAAARRLVCERYSAETVARQFEAICQQTVERRAVSDKQ